MTTTFLLMKGIPGDPFTSEQAAPPEILEALRDHYGLNDPLITQYKNYLYSICSLDFGPSFVYQGRSVNAIIQEGFPLSAALGLQAITLALIGGVALGTLSALHRGKWQDTATMSLAVLGLSLPSFVIGALLQYLFALKLTWFPLARFEGISSLVLPTLALAALPLAFIARMVRTNMLEVLRQDYIKLAYAKGLTRWQVLTRHAFKNSLTPLLGYLAQLGVNILVGSFVIEKIFSLPGLGQWFVISVQNRDYTVITGVTVFYSALLLGGMLLADLLQSALDPRVRLTS